MARENKSDRERRILGEARIQFDQIQSALRDERLQCVQDRRFASISGAQWEGPLGEQFANKPKLEVNKIAMSLTRIENEYRNNPITVDFVPKDGRDDDALADLCDSLWRADEQDSNAEEAYDNAFQEAITGGFGAFRLRERYEDEESEDDERQRIAIEPIFDADTSVWFDLDAKRQDKSDARFCFVIVAMTHDAYLDQWGDDPASWPKEINTLEFDWCTPDVVYVAEYYRVEEVSDVVTYWKGLDGSEVKHRLHEVEEDDGKLRITLEAQGYQEMRRKKLKTRKVRKWILSGNAVLEDCGYIAGKFIPIIPVYGKRWFIDNIERCMGQVRLAKDAQRLKNMQISKMAEISALSSVEKPILTPEQIAGHQVMWSEDNIKDYPYLLINPITNPDGTQTIGGPVAYTKSAQIPPAMAALLQVTEVDMGDILGRPQDGDKMLSNQSGRAVELIQQRLDGQTFIYVSNLAKALQWAGKVWLSKAREVYVEDDRPMKVIAVDGAAGTKELNRPTVTDEGEVTTENDLSRADFDVAVDVGPSSSSKRAATVRALTGMLGITADPETQMVISSVALMNMEGEGLGDIRKWTRRRLLRMGAVEATEEERAEMQQEAAAQQKDPNAVYLEAASQEAVAKAAQARANTVLTVAKAEETRAKTDQIRAETIGGVADLDMRTRGPQNQ